MDWMESFLDSAVLMAWPASAVAEAVLVKRLHQERGREFDRLPSSRDYGRLIEAYERQIGSIERRDAQSPALEGLRRELTALREDVAKLAPEAERIFDDGVYETSFLEAFLSNYPQSPQRRAAALKLGQAYSRLGRESEAVEQFLAVWRPGRNGEVEDDLSLAAGRGLRNLAPVLQQLGALEQLATQELDDELQELAARRLDEQASKFERLENGAAYLEQFPEGLYVDTVTARMEDLAENLYKEMVLYQQIGDSAKSIARASKIVELAPFSPAAQRLSEQLERQDVPN